MIASELSGAFFYFRKGVGMSIFDVVKENITVRQAAEAYGFKPDRMGLIRCIFHPDRRPSMKVDQRYYCFGCNRTGDVIDFTEQLFGLDPKEAAEKLAEDFGLTEQNKWKSDRQSANRKRDYEEKVERNDSLNRKLEFCKDILLFHRKLLRHYEDYYAPKETDEEWDKRFTLALKQRPIVEHQLDILFFGTKDEQKALIEELERGEER